MIRKRDRTASGKFSDLEEDVTWVVQRKDGDETA
jgi:hypothetical protein